MTDALWPDAEGDAADQALRTTLHRLRRLLRHEQAVQLTDRHLHLDTRWISADCLAFDRAARLPGLTGRADLQRVLQHYRGAFLEGEPAAWAQALRDRLRAAFLSLAQRLGDLLERDGDWPAAVECYLQAIAAEPVAEAIYRRLMNAHAQLGSRSEAMAAYQRCRQTLLTRQGVGPAARRRRSIGVWPGLEPRAAPSSTARGRRAPDAPSA